MTTEATILERFGEWAAGLTLDDIPPRVVDKIRLQMVTSVSASASAPWHEPARRVLDARRSEGTSVVFATGDRLAPQDAAFTNAAFAMALDYDDYLLSGHTGYSAVLTPLAFATGVDQVVVAAAVANELMGRLSTASLLGPLNGQMSSYIHNAGAAASTASVLGLPPSQMTAAVALALYQPNYCLAPGFWNEDAKTVTASMPLAQGIRAAELAAAGLGGPADLMEHPLGFPTTFAFAPFPGLFDGLGSVWFSDTLCYKRYPGTSYISAAVEGALAAGGARPHDVADIQSVRVETTFLSSTLDSIGAAAIARTPLDANAVNFSVRLSVAAALRFGDITPDRIRPERLAEEEGAIRAIARRVEVVHDWAQTARMMSESPLGTAMLAHLSPAAAARLVLHGRRLNRASASAGRNRSRYRGLLRVVPSLARQLASAPFTPVSASRFDPESFRMLQSARVRLETPAGDRSEFIEIPVGACGRDPGEARELVLWRCQLAFGDLGLPITRLLLEPGHDVGSLNRLIEGSQTPGLC